MKITYRNRDGDVSIGYIEDKPVASPEIYDGTDKHTDAPIRVQWLRFHWVQVGP